MANEEETKTSRSFKILGSLAILLAVIFFSRPSPISSSDVEVNWTSKELSNEEILYLIDLSELDRENASEDAIRARYLRSIMKAKVFEKNFHALTRQILEGEARRIQGSSINPEKLQKIQKIFSGHKDNYLRLYVLPIYVERELPYGAFPNDVKIHAETRAQARDVLKNLIRRPDLIATYAVNPGWHFHRYNLSEKKESKVADPSAPELDLGGSELATDRGSLELSGKKAFLWNQVVGHLKRGQTLPRLVESPESFCIDAYQENTQDAQPIIDEICLEKQSYGDWLAKQIESL